MLAFPTRPPGRPRGCHCGECRRCRNADRARDAYRALSLEERRALIARRDPELVAARERARSKTRAKQAAVTRSQQRHPDRHLARVAVHNAVKRGHMTKGRCHCGEIRVEAHHPDYTKRLEVVWLCRRHHVEQHRKEAASAS